VEQIAIVMHDTHSEAQSQGLIASVEAGWRAVLPRLRLAARAAWRDNRLMTLMAHARAQA
jgi:hypothetical protein